MKYLTHSQIVELHEKILEESGGLSGIRDESSLMATSESPPQAVFGQELYPTIFQKAAVYIRGIIKGHPFFEGNKRTAMVVATIFLEINNYYLAASQKKFEEFAVYVAENKLELEEIAAWLKANSKKIKK